MNFKKLYVGRCDSCGRNLYKGDTIYNVRLGEADLQLCGWCVSLSPASGHVVELPARHGRLADIDALINDLEYDAQRDLLMMDDPDYDYRINILQDDRDIKLNAAEWLRGCEVLVPAYDGEQG